MQIRRYLTGIIVVTFLTALCNGSAAYESLRPVRNLKWDMFHVPGGISSDPNIKIDWDHSDGEPLYYFVLFDTNPEHTFQYPEAARYDFIIWTGITSWEIAEAVPDDVAYYFHVAADDNGGVIGPTTTVGPFRIDTREEGISFESEHALQPGTPIYIKMTDFSLNDHAPGVHDVYIGKVRQCRRVRNNCAYRTSVQYMARGHICSGRNVHKSELMSCDLCGKKTPWQEVHETDDSLYLCLDCFKHLGKLIDGKIKECVTRFMDGNVI